jgi:hypothetical protein
MGHAGGLYCFLQARPPAPRQSALGQNPPPLLILYELKAKYLWYSFIYMPEILQWIL